MGGTKEDWQRGTLMRIGMLCSTPLPPQEGIGYLVWNLSKHLIDRGHKVVLITRGDARASWVEEVDGMPVWRTRFLPLYPFHSFIHYLSVHSLLKRIGNALDILHIHSPLIAYPGDSLPTLVTVHSPMSNNLTKDLALKGWQGWQIRMQSPFSILIERRLFSKADRLAAISASVAKELDFYKNIGNEVSIISNAVDTDLFRPQESPIGSNPPYFFTACRLAPGKGLNDLLDCASLVSRYRTDIKFLIAGKGPLEQEIYERIKRTGLGNTVELLGQVSDRMKMVEYYSQAAACIHPSHSEGMPTVVLEAMACGRPVIATEVSGSIDLVDHKINGLLVPPHQPKALMEAVMCLFNDRELAQRLGAAGRKKVCELYSWKKVGDQYLNAYRDICNQRGKEGGRS